MKFLHKVTKKFGGNVIIAGTNGKQQYLIGLVLKIIALIVVILLKK